MSILFHRIVAIPRSRSITPSKQKRRKTVTYTPPPSTTPSEPFQFFSKTLSETPLSTNNTPKSFWDAVQKKGGIVINLESLFTFRKIDPDTFESDERSPVVLTKLRTFCMRHIDPSGKISGLECRLRPGFGALLKGLGISSSPIHFMSDSGLHFPLKLGLLELYQRDAAIHKVLSTIEMTPTSNAKTWSVDLEQWHTLMAVHKKSDLNACVLVISNCDPLDKKSNFKGLIEAGKMDYLKIPPASEEDDDHAFSKLVTASPFKQSPRIVGKGSPSRRGSLSELGTLPYFRL